MADWEDVPDQSGGWEDVPSNQYALQDVPKTAAKNVGADALRTANDYATGISKAAHDPLGTLKTVGLTGGATVLGGLVPGLPARLGLGQYDIGGQTAKKIIDAASNPSQTYEDAKTAVAERPVNSAINVLGLASGGEGTLGRALLKVPTTVLKGADALALRPLSSMAAGTGNAMKLAGQAGEEGGAAGKAFLADLAKPNPKGIVTDAQDALRKSRAANNATYQANAAPWMADPTQLTSAPGALAQAVGDARSSLPSRGVTGATQGPHAVVDDIENEILDHLTTPGKDLSAASLDDLKQKLGMILEGQQEGTHGRRVAQDIYSSLRDELGKVPGYSDTMTAYSDPLKDINEAAKSLSLGQRASRGTALNKLLSGLRPNDGGGGLFSSRSKDLALLDQSDPNLKYRLAGTTLHPLMPRGILGRLVTTENAGEVLPKAAEWAGGLAGVGGLALLPGLAKTLGGLALLSPRLQGSMRYGVGALNRYARAAGASQKNLGLLAEGSRLYGQDDGSGQ